MSVDVFHPCEWLDSVAAVAPFRHSGVSGLMDLPGYIGLQCDGDHNLRSRNKFRDVELVEEFERARLSERLVTRR